MENIEIRLYDNASLIRKIDNIKSIINSTEDCMTVILNTGVIMNILTKSGTRIVEYTAI